MSEINETVASLVSREVELLLGDVIETGAIMLIQSHSEEAFLVTGNFSLRFLFNNSLLEVSYIYFDEELNSLKSFDLRDHLKKLSPEKSNLKLVQNMSAAVEDCFFCLAQDDGTLWSGKRDWISPAWENESPEEPMASSLRMAWGFSPY